jgi:hypothetical protein
MFWNIGNTADFHMVSKSQNFEWYYVHVVNYKEIKDYYYVISSQLHTRLST